MDLRLRADVYLVAYYLAVLDGPANKKEQEHLLRMQRALGLSDALVQEVQGRFV